MKIIGYKCQYCKKNFPTNDHEHERTCKISSKKLKSFKQEFVKIKPIISKIVYDHLKKSEIVINLFEAYEFLHDKISYDPYYDMSTEQNYFQNEAICIINTLIEEHLSTYIPDTEYPDEDFRKEQCIDLIRESILRKFKKIYPNIRVW